MPAPETTAWISAAYQQIAASMPGFRQRPTQKRMVWEVAKALDGTHPHHLLAIEAPTGTGKSLGYLLGGLPVARERGLPLVVATASVTLQEQILNQDLPKLAQYGGIEVRAAVAKGRGRYLCPRNLHALLADGSAESSGGQQSLAPEVVGSAAWMRLPRPGEVEGLQAMDEALQAERWGGDLDEWPAPPSTDLRAMITSSAHSCSGRRCSHYDGCPVYAARMRVRGAELVVANHDLLLADLLLGEEQGGVVLPHPGESLYVIDEGHRLAEKAIRRFAVGAKVQGAREWLEEAQQLVRSLALAVGPQAGAQPQECADAVQGQLRAAHAALQEADTFLQHNFVAGADEPIWRFRAGRTPPPVRELAKRVAAPTTALHADLERLAAALEQALDNTAVSKTEIERYLPRFGALRERVRNLDATWEQMCGEERGDEPPVARWIERHEGKSGQGDHRVAAAPVSIADELAHRLWGRCRGAVITSATLAALGRFRRLRDDLGLPDAPQLAVGCLPSPFDYSRSLLCVPAMRTDPKAAAAHTEEVVERLAEVVAPHEATLVLFTSRARMEQVAAALPAALVERLQCQDDSAREEMLRRHRAAVDAGEGSLLFGLASFAEGVDLPGAYCDHVVIERIPFAVPSEPVEATRSEWVEEQGRRAFAEISLPNASLRLVQACGRLVRSEADRGRITILDRRIVTHSYGKALLNALPPFRREIG